MGVPAADLDNDGDLDLVLIRFYSQPVILRNETNDKNWLRVRSTGTLSSQDGIGTKVSLFSVVGGKKQLIGFRQIHSGAGYCRGSPVEANFRLVLCHTVIDGLESRLQTVFPA